MSLFEKGKKQEINRPGYLDVNPMVKKRAERGESGEEAGTIIGRNSKIEGKLKAKEDVIIEGNINGNVRVEKDFTISPDGNVKATVHANSVCIKGKMLGDIVAKSRVEILPSGSLEGNIKAPAIMISEGAFFRGNVDMGKALEGEEKEEKPLITAKESKIAPLAPLAPDKTKTEKKY